MNASATSSSPPLRMVPPAATHSVADAAAPSSAPSLRGPAGPAVPPQGYPRLAPTAFSSRRCSHFGQPSPCNTDKSPRRAGGNTQGSGMLELSVPAAEPSPRTACAWRSYWDERGPFDPGWLQSQSQATGILGPCGLSAPSTVSPGSPRVPRAGCLHHLNGIDCAPR